MSAKKLGLRWATCANAQPNDDLAFEQVVNVPARGIGNTTLSQLRQAAREHGLSLYQSVERLLSGEIDLPPPAQNRWWAFQAG